MCGCGKSQPYVVVLPGGKTKSYSSAIAAQAELDRVEGSYLRADTPLPTS